MHKIHHLEALHYRAIEPPNITTLYKTNKRYIFKNYAKRRDRASYIRNNVCSVYIRKTKRTTLNSCARSSSVLFGVAAIGYSIAMLYQILSYTTPAMEPCAQRFYIRVSDKV